MKSQLIIIVGRNIVDKEIVESKGFIYRKIEKDQTSLK
jgi:hypothetical protein